MTIRFAFAGSFDPFTKGHENIVDQALDIADELVIIIANNSSKKYFFNLQERIAIITKTLSQKYGNRIKIVEAGNKFTVDICSEHHCSHLVRGIRNAEDLAYELNLKYGNALANDSIKTILFAADNPNISSSFVKAIATPTNGLYAALDLVSDFAREAIAFNIIESILKENVKINQHQLEWILADIRRGYSNRESGYHNLTHIATVLQHLRDSAFVYTISNSDRTALFLAAAYHDYIYEGGDDRNEVRSAIHAFDVTNSMLVDSSTISHIIESTKFGFVKPTDNSSVLNNMISLMHDVDYFITSSNVAVYKEYVKRIQRELYQSKGTFDVEKWLKGRSAFLRQLLTSPIFLTKEYTRYEQQARRNVQDELTNMHSFI